MKECDYAGARWWKFDFHTHTPASFDFKHGSEKVTAESWLKAYIKKGIDCVAVTDHNSGDWIDRLKEKLKELEENRPEWYRPLFLFPGVEISTYDNVHVLAIFDSDKDRSHVEKLITLVDYPGKRGDSDDVTNKNIKQVIDEIIKLDGIAIPAHVDGRKGIFDQERVGLEEECLGEESRRFKLDGKILERLLNNKDIYAAEVTDSNYEMPQLYVDQKSQWTKVIGSDTHCFEDSNFGIYTWVKMDKPSIEGLKLALVDGPVSVRYDMSNDQNRHADCFVEELIVSKAKYIGHSKPLKSQFSPFLNTIIGGRGAGKSTLLEFMRLILGRKEDIPSSLKKESDQYFNRKEGNGLLLDNSSISLIYRKGENRYRLNWHAETMEPSFECQEGDEWVQEVGDIKSQFPAYIYSQKQIFELAKNPSALIDIIDESPEVEYRENKTIETDLVNKYKQYENKQRELNEKISQEDFLNGEVRDLTRQIKQIQDSGHTEVLKTYQNRKQQLEVFEYLKSQWKEMKSRLLETRDIVGPKDYNKQYFVTHPEISSAIEKTNHKWVTINEKLSELVDEAQLVIDEWNAAENNDEWMQKLKSDTDEYEQLCLHLESQGIDPNRYPSLLDKEKNTQIQLREISDGKIRHQELEKEKQQVFEQIIQNRKKMSEKRQSFLESVLAKNQFVSIEVEPFGEDWDSIEEKLREILQCQDRFDKDIEVLRGTYLENDEDKIEKLKNLIIDIRNGEKDAIDKRFYNHMQRLTQESISELLLWLPKDNLKVTFGPNNQQIEQASPGQKTAALLAFILSYGNEPLLLDQPEDDLDNELIYKLIVKQLRDTKSRRQVIIVTHNANIVVNGDAEMVLPLHVVRTETRIKKAASIQDKEVRGAICAVLEGGEQAFEQRYKRIHLED